MIKQNKRVSADYPYTFIKSDAIVNDIMIKVIVGIVGVKITSENSFTSVIIKYPIRDANTLIDI